LTTTLLAVDDSKTMRKVMEIAFSGEPGYQTVLADSAQDALAKLSSAHPGIALVDVTLPDQNGYDLCQQIKSQAPGIGVIVLSSKQQPYDQGKGSACGADDFNDKPFDTQQLIDKVTRLAASGTVAKAPAVAAAAPPKPAPMAAQPPLQAAPKPAAPTPIVAAPTPRPMAAPAPAAAAAARRIVSSPPPKPKAAPAAVAAVASGELAERLQNLGLTQDQVAGVLALSREVIEKVVWEVVPVLAETLINEEIQRLTSE
jgi:CheY-like chemotaxis protein